MSQLQLEPGLYSSLSRIPEALRNERALFALLVTNLLGAALIFLGYTLHEPMIMVVLIILLSLLVLPIGSAIAGLLLMDQARGQQPRSLDRALADGLYIFPRILGVSLLSVSMTVILCLVIGGLLLICKLPFIGAALYAVLFPVLVILAGGAFFGFMAGLSITGPAIWSGASVREALALVWRLAGTRLPELLIGLLLLVAFILMVGCVLGSILYTGFTFVKGASLYILGTELEKEFLFGTMIGIALILSAITAMSMMGLNLIFLRLTQDPDLARAQEPARPAPARERSVTPPQRMEPSIQPLPSANDRARSISAQHFPSASNKPAGGERNTPPPAARPAMPFPSTPPNRPANSGGRTPPAHSAPTIMMTPGMLPDSLLNSIERNTPLPVPPRSTPPEIPVSRIERNMPPEIPVSRVEQSMPPEIPVSRVERSTPPPPPPAHSAPTVMVSRSGLNGPVSSGGQDIIEQFLAAQQIAKETAPARPTPEPGYYPPPPFVSNTPVQNDRPDIPVQLHATNPFAAEKFTQESTESTPQTIACPRCKTVAHFNDSFCGACGARLHGWT